MPGQLAFPAPCPYRSPFKKSGSYDLETEMDFGWSMIGRQSVGSLAAFIVEPIVSTGGILVPLEGYLARLSIEKRNAARTRLRQESGRSQMFAFEHDRIATFLRFQRRWAVVYR